MYDSDLVRTIFNCKKIESFSEVLNFSAMYAECSFDKLISTERVETCQNGKGKVSLFE